MDYRQSVKNIYSVVKLLGLSLIASVFIAGALLNWMNAEFPPEKGVMDMPAMFKIIVLLVSFVGIFSIPVLKKIFLEHNPVAQMVYIPKSVFIQLQWTLFSVSLLSLGFCVAPAFYGFCLFFVTRNFNDYCVLGAISLVAFLLYFPHSQDWEVWLFKQSAWKKMVLDEMKADAMKIHPLKDSSPKG